MQRSKPDKFLSFAEVAEMIGLSKGTVQNGEGGTRDLPRIKLGGRVLFSLRAVELWMAAKAREAERRKAHARDVVSELLADRRRQREAVEKCLTEIVKGAK